MNSLKSVFTQCGFLLWKNLTAILFYFQFVTRTHTSVYWMCDVFMLNSTEKQIRKNYVTKFSCDGMQIRSTMNSWDVVYAMHTYVWLRRKVHAMWIVHSRQVAWVWISENFNFCSSRFVSPHVTFSYIRMWKMNSKCLFLVKIDTQRYYFQVAFSIEAISGVSILFETTHIWTEWYAYFSYIVASMLFTSFHGSWKAAGAATVTATASILW